MYVLTFVAIFHVFNALSAWADAGVEPIDFPEAPTKALPIALSKANLTINDIAQFEFNEAFSVVVRIAEKVCGLDGSKINVNGYVLQVFRSSICRSDLHCQRGCGSGSCNRKLWFSNHRFPSTLPQVW